ncbi:hypothetical protein RQM47_01315 [Rubrivirga sp. S365]|nr:hypothetical protein [Rubrivirga sp. S365]MDT7855274.1 hypothetical protein [Rubrivirga sp. S365]
MASPVSKIGSRSSCMVLAMSGGNTSWAVFPKRPSTLPAEVCSAPVALAAIKRPSRSTAKMASGMASTTVWSRRRRLSASSVAATSRPYDADSASWLSRSAWRSRSRATLTIPSAVRKNATVVASDASGSASSPTGGAVHAAGMKRVKARAASEPNSSRSVRASWAITSPVRAVAKRCVDVQFVSSPFRTAAHPKNRAAA